MVTPEMLLFLAGKMGLESELVAGTVDYVESECKGYKNYASFNPATDDAQFGRMVVWAAMQGLEPDFSHGVVRVWPIGKDYPCAEENDSTPGSIRAAAVVAVCRALGWEARDA